MRLPHACECVCIAQVDSKLTSFVTALSEISSVTDPTYGPNGGGAADSEISSLTDPTGSERSSTRTHLHVQMRARASRTDPTYGPNSGGAADSEISSLTDPTGSGSRGEADAGVGKSAIAVADAVAVASGAGDSSTTLVPYPTREDFEAKLDSILAEVRPFDQTRPTHPPTHPHTHTDPPPDCA